MRNYDETATIADADACEFPGDECDDEDATTINDAYNDDCECVGIVDGIAEDAGRHVPQPNYGEVTLEYGWIPHWSDHSSDGCFRPCSLVQ